MEANRDCPFCDKKATLKSTIAEKKFKREKYKATEFFYRCESCGEEFTTKKRTRLRLIRSIIVIVKNMEFHSRKN